MKKILFLVLTLTTLASFASAQNTLIYKEQGGAKEVVLSGGEIEVRSGGLIDMQAGSTLTVANAAVIGIISTPTFSNLTVTYGVGAATGAFSGVVDVNGNFTSGADNYVTTNTASSGAWAFPATVSIGGALSGASGAFSTTLDVTGNEYHGAALYRSTFTAASGAQAWTGALTSAAAITGASLKASSGALTLAPNTRAEICAIDPAVAGELRFCSNCSTTGELLFSTGTAVNQYKFGSDATKGCE